MQPVGSVMIASRALSSTISRTAAGRSSASENSCPTSSSASGSLGVTTVGSARVPTRSASPSESSTVSQSMPLISPIRRAYRSSGTPRGSEPEKTHTSAPFARYSSLSTNSSSSVSDTDGPFSLISVCCPFVGSTTAVEVRDSSRIRTKSLRIASSVSCSMMRVPVGPPATPVAITGIPSVFSARATLTPLPPAMAVCSTARWRRPRRKFGTASVLSIAALSVTVMIIGSSAPRTLPNGPHPERQQHRGDDQHEQGYSHRHPTDSGGRLPHDPRPRHALGRDQGYRANDPPPHEHVDAADLVAGCERPLDLRGRRDARPHGPSAPRREEDVAGRDESHRAAVVA